MGIVFAATQLATGRKVALKWMRSRGRLREDRERDQAYRRFVREAQVAGRIRHPNVVDVLDAGVDPGAPYLVMELLEGETLRARMEARGPMAWDEAMQLILPVMSGVGAAHAQGVIHRDLKPDNVFLARDGAGNEVAKVLDFGISRLHGTENSGEPSLTRTGTMIGTPAYMPLEQLRGSGESDERTDVYALGVVLYEMLAGQRPYSARNAADFAVQIASDAITPLGWHRPDLAGMREGAVMRALSREPAARFGSVDTFSESLLGSAGTAKGRRLRRAPLLVGAGLLSAAAAVHLARCSPSVRRSPAVTSAPRALLEPARSPAADAAPQAPMLPPSHSAPDTAPAVSVETPQPTPRRSGSSARVPTRRATAAPADFSVPLGAPSSEGRPGAPSLELDREQF